MTQDSPSFDSAELPGNAHAADEHAAQPAADAAKITARQPAAAVTPGPAKLQPGWVLSASGEQLTREEILARYRRQRGLPEDPFENGARPVPPPGYRDRIMNAPRPARFMERHAPEAAAPPPRQPRTFTLGQTMAISAAMALVAGGGAGVLSAWFPQALTRAVAPLLAGASATETPPALPGEQLQVAQAQPLQAPQVAAARDTVIDKKPVSTATLQVADVTGETNSFIPLALHAVPAGLEKDMLLKISGVPEGAYLTSGHRQDDQVWALSLDDIRDLKLVVPRTDDPQIDLAVAAFEPGTGELAAPVKTMTVALSDVVVQPASAPPPDPAATASAGPKSTLPGANTAMAVAIPPPESVKLAMAVPETAETRDLIDDAASLLARGDVTGARRNYERAWGNDGSAAAAFGLARSYDPLVLAALSSSNGTPDRAQALRWYQRAASAGNPEATKAIIRLQMKP